MSNLIFGVDSHRITEDGVLREDWPNGWPNPLDDNFDLFVKDCMKFNSDMFYYNGSSEGIRRWVSDAQTNHLYKIFCLFGSTYNKHIDSLDYVVKSIDKISDDEKYIYTIQLHGSGMLNYSYFKQFGLKISDTVLEDCRNGQAKILLHELKEGHGFNLTRVKEFFEHNAEVLNIPLDSFAFLDGNYMTPKLQSTYGTKGFCQFAWEEHSPELGEHEPVVEPTREQQRIDEIVNKQYKPYHFVCLNRRSRSHRIRLVTHIANRWPDKFLFSHLENFNVNVECFNDTNIRGGSPVDDLIDQGILTKELYLKFPFKLDVDASVNDTQLNPELMSKAYINVTTETMFFENNTQFFSEKVFKPILFIQPFILVGSYNSLQLLRDMGYKTFHPIINEEYDKQEDAFRRMDMILDEIDRLSNFTHDQMKQLVYDCKDILIHNLENIKYRRREGIADKVLIRQLQEWIDGC